MIQRIFQGTWCDIAQQGDTTLHVTALPTGIVEYRSAAFLDSPPIQHNVQRWLLCLRAAGTENGHILIAGQDHDSGNVYFAIDGGTPTNLGPGNGVHVVSVQGFADHWHLWVARVGRIDHYEVNQFGTTTLLDQVPTGTSQGFLDSGHLADLDREHIPGLVYPCQAGGYAVGQNAGPDPARLRVALAGKLAAVYVGYAQRPQALFHGGTLYVAAYVGSGSLFQAWDPAEIGWGNDTAAPPPPPIPDQPFVVDPAGVVPDIATWLWAQNQGPDVHLNGLVRFFCKSDEVSGDGPGAHIGEHWDMEPVPQRADGPLQLIGHLDDASTGQRVYQGKAVTAEQWVTMGQPVPWASLPLNHNWWDDGARAWLPRRCTSGLSIKYWTNIRWTTGAVQGKVPIEIRVDVGYGVIHGKPVRVRGQYLSFDGAKWNLECNYYGEPRDYNAWVAGPYATTDAEWMR